jgi:hypothetical protein
VALVLTKKHDRLDVRVSQTFEGHSACSKAVKLRGLSILPKELLGSKGEYRYSDRLARLGPNIGIAFPNLGGNSEGVHGCSLAVLRHVHH